MVISSNFPLVKNLIKHSPSRCICCRATTVPTTAAMKSSRFVRSHTKTYSSWNSLRHRSTLTHHLSSVKSCTCWQKTPDKTECALCTSRLRYCYSYSSTYRTILQYKGSAWVPAGTHAPDREIYLSAKSPILLSKLT